MVAEDVDGEVAAAGVDEGLGDDAPVVEGLAVGAVGPADAGGGVDVGVGGAGELLLSGELELVGVDREAGVCGRWSVMGG